jgi:NAD(P) transhydrogenase
MLKLLFERDSHRLRGVHIVGASASDLIHIGQAVLSSAVPSTTSSTPSSTTRRSPRRIASPR